MQSQKNSALSIREAAERSPVLSRLSVLIQQSQVCMDTVIPFLPISLRRQVSPGPIEDDTWCILAHSSAIAGKLRQLKPDMEQALGKTETGVKYIRIRVVASK